jgi:hypothetical protein
VASRLSHQSGTPSYIRTEGGGEGGIVGHMGINREGRGRVSRDQVERPGEQVAESVWSPHAHAGSSLADFSTLKMEAIRSSETSVHTTSTWRHIPEDGILHSHRCENFKCYVINEVRFTSVTSLTQTFLIEMKSIIIRGRNPRLTGCEL